jgi:hypothetical protein
VEQGIAEVSREFRDVAPKTGACSAPER